MSKRAAAWLFAIVAVVQLVPVWSVRYIPTNDGPEHVYNALVIHDLVAGRENAITKTYAIDPHPYPNWIGHALMAMLMAVVPPVIAEKLLFSAIVLMFLAAAWMLARSSSPAYAFLAIPFTFHSMLQTGFYNYSLGVALCIATIAMWWKRRDTPDARTISAIAAMLVLCYFSHPLSIAVAIISIAMLWLGTLRGRRLAVHARHLVAFIPVTPLVAWYALSQGGSAGGGHRPFSHSLFDLASARILLTFSHRQLELGACVVAAMIGLGCATLVIERHGDRREENAFLVILPLLLALYFLSPETVAGGQMLAERTVLFAYLLPIAWFSPRIPRKAQNAIVIVLSVIGVANAAYLTDRYRRYEPLVDEIVGTAARAAPESRILPILFNRSTDGAFVPLLWHAAAYAAAERRLIDLDNYEPRPGYFPTKYRRGAAPPDFSVVEYKPDAFDVAGAAMFARYITTWKMPPNSRVATALDRQYRLVHADGHTRLYERRSAIGVETLGAFDQVLLPLAGTRTEAGGMLGARWRIDQAVTNKGAAPIHIALSHCEGMTSCDFDLKPAERVAITADDPIRPFVYAYVPRAAANTVEFSTIAHRTDRWFPEADINAPAVPFREFESHRVSIPNVPFAPGMRLNLRLYTIGPTPTSATVRVVAADGHVLGTATLPVYATNYYSDSNLGARFSGANGIATVSIETSANVWAFITGTDAQGQSTVYLPPSLSRETALE